jgi:hypothetical protein
LNERIFPHNCYRQEANYQSGDTRSGKATETAKAFMVLKTKAELVQSFEKSCIFGSLDMF